METLILFLIWLAVTTHLVVDGQPFPMDDASQDDLVRHYFRLSFTADEIIGFLLFVHNIVMSRRTLCRILRRLNLRRYRAENSIADIVSGIHELHRMGFHSIGYRSAWRLLRTQYGLQATQETVRICLRIIDGNGVDTRQRRRLLRRVYVNQGPNYLIHIDGYDKLKPFGIAIHGAIDGYSRKILWLTAGPSNNNPRHIAFHFINFLKEIRGVPRLIRSDHGTENVLVRAIQVALRMNHIDDHAGERSYSYGRSTGNQRIEMLWSFLARHFTQFWRNLFKDMVDDNVLDNTNPLHIQCIRICFLGVIQRHLNVFKRYWNSHRIRAQRRVDAVSGIPDVLYHQPLIYDTVNYAFNLPCSVEVLDDIIDRFAEQPQPCSDDFLRLIALRTNVNIEEFSVLRTAEDAKDVYRVLLGTLQ